MEGSVKITLYKEFLATLPNGTYTLKVLFKEGEEFETDIVIDRAEPARGGGCNTGAMTANAGMAGMLAALAVLCRGGMFALRRR